LNNVLKKYNFKNLDQMFPDDNTTTEFMCKVICDDLAQHFCRSKGFSGAICVKLWESHKAWASYEKSV